MLEQPGDVELAVRQLYRIGFDKVTGWITVEEARAYKLLTENTPRVQFDDFDAAIADQQGAIVDVRTSSEHQNSHLPGAISMPYTRLKEQVEKIPRAKRLFVHCASGYRAALASSFLQAQGYDVVHVDGAYSSFRGTTRQT
jgi:hydroxyacylglutathione hydrolase